MNYIFIADVVFNFKLKSTVTVTMLIKVELQVTYNNCFNISELSDLSDNFLFSIHKMILEFVRTHFGQLPAKMLLT
jgi:hypothetical protein